MVACVLPDPGDSRFNLWVSHIAGRFFARVVVAKECSIQKLGKARNRLSPKPPENTSPLTS